MVQRIETACYFITMITIALAFGTFMAMSITTIPLWGLVLTEILIFDKVAACRAKY